MKAEIQTQSASLAGKLLTGNLDFTLQRPQSIATVSVELVQTKILKGQGLEQVEKDGKTEQQRWQFDDSGRYVLDETSYQVGTLTPGFYQFGFQFLVPDDVPSTGGNDSVCVSYHIHAIVQPRRGTAIEVNHPLHVYRPSQANMLDGKIPKSQTRIFGNIEVEFSPSRALFTEQESPTFVVKVQSEAKVPLTISTSIVLHTSVGSGSRAQETWSSFETGSKETLPPFFYGHRVVKFKPVGNTWNFVNDTKSFSTWAFIVDVNGERGQLHWDLAPASLFRGVSLGALPQSIPWVAYRPLWELASSSCPVCHKPFHSIMSFLTPSERFRIRHHCRFCMRGVCGYCSEAKPVRPDFGYTKRHRACDACMENPPRLHAPLTISDLQVPTTKPLDKGDSIAPVQFVAGFGENNNTNNIDVRVAPVINVTPVFNIASGANSNISTSADTVTAAKASAPPPYADTTAAKASAPPL